MKLEAGKFYRTRDGRKAFVAWINERDGGANSAVGFIEPEGRTHSWRLDGRFNPHNGSPDTQYDLVAEWTDPPAKPVECWRQRLAGGGLSRVCFSTEAAAVESQLGAERFIEAAPLERRLAEQAKRIAELEAELAKPRQETEADDLGQRVRPMFRRSRNPGVRQI